MNTILRSLFLIPTLALSVNAQGPLTPSAGPAPTMKALNEIEPRTMLQALAAGPPYIISAPGSYYLTASIIATGGQNAIEIQSSSVTLDLNGFSITSIGAATGGMAIYATKPAVIKNGYIKGAGVTSAGSYTAIGFGTGIYMPAGGSATDITIDGCSSGLYMEGSVNRCKVTNAMTGINAAIVIQSEARSCSSTGITFTTSCSGSYGSGHSYGIISNGGRIEHCEGIAVIADGIIGGNVSNSKGAGGGIGISSSENVSDSTGIVKQDPSSPTSLYGIKATGTVSNSKATCTATSGVFTQWFAIQCDSAMNCSATSSGQGIRAFANVTNCYGKAGNGAIGIWADGTASFCRGDHTSSTGVAIQAGIAVACTYANGYISANKQLGTP